MNIDWSAFTPWSAAIGGVVIGLAAALFVLINGRGAGSSGIVGGMLYPRAGDFELIERNRTRTDSTTPDATSARPPC
jgi:uncharacterized membrane protein YedE/YeeE